VRCGGLHPERTLETDRPRAGFLGLGWMGLSRLRAVAESGAVQIAAVADPAPDAVHKALEVAPEAETAGTLDDLLRAGLDALVIATPSALHAEQAEQALAAGLAVFCQKPLGRTQAEVRRVLDAARASDRLLDVDMSYRRTQAMRSVRRSVAGGAVGQVHAVELVFHNAYGPDKAWFFDPRLSGGGCVIDLGIHLVDLALWVLDFPEVEGVRARLFAGGRRVAALDGEVEDYAAFELDLAGGAAVRAACSWRLPAGRDAVIEAAYYGSEGGAAMRNRNGSFYDFAAELYRGTSTEVLAQPPDQWFGRAAAEWAARLAAGARYDPEVESLVQVHRVVDEIYGR
jgi:predicted dehydrogenase